MVKRINGEDKYPIKLVATDFDGSFSPKMSQIGRVNAESARRFLERDENRHLAVVSARQPASLADCLGRAWLGDLVQAKRISLSGFNGSLTQFDGKRLIDKPLPNSLTGRTLQNCQTHGINAVFHTPLTIYVLQNDSWMKLYAENSMAEFKEGVPNPNAEVYLIELRQPNGLKNREMNRMFGIPEIVRRKQAHTYAFSPSFSGNDKSGARWVHLTSHGINKSLAVLAYKTRMKLSQGETLVLGDGINDIEALNLSGEVGVTFEDADERVIKGLKGKDKYIAPPSENNGFAYALNNLVR